MQKYKLTCMIAVLAMTASAHGDVCGPGACWTGEYNRDRVPKVPPPSGAPDNRGSGSGGGSGGGGGLIGGLLRRLFSPPPPETSEQRAARIKREAEQRAEWERQRAEEARLIAEGKKLQAQHDGFTGFIDAVADRESQPESYVRGLYQPIKRPSRASRPPAAAAALRAEQAAIDARLKVLDGLKGKPNEVSCTLNFPPRLHVAGSAGNQVWARYVDNMTRSWDAECGGAAAPSFSAAPAQSAAVAGSTGPQATPSASGTRRESTAREQLDAAAVHGAGAAGASRPEDAALGASRILDRTGSAVPPQGGDVPPVPAPTPVEGAVPPALQKSEQWQRLEQQQTILQKNADAVEARLRVLSEQRQAQPSPRQRAKLDGEVKKLEQERAALIPQINMIKDTKKAVLKAFIVSFDEEDKGPSPTQPPSPKPPAPAAEPAPPLTPSRTP